MPWGRVLGVGVRNTLMTLVRGVCKKGPLRVNGTNVHQTSTIKPGSTVFLWGVGGRVHQKGLLGWESVDV